MFHNVDLFIKNFENYLGWNKRKKKKNDRINLKEADVDKLFMRNWLIISLLGGKIMFSLISGFKQWEPLSIT